MAGWYEIAKNDKGNTVRSESGHARQCCVVSSTNQRAQLSGVASAETTERRALRSEDGERWAFLPPGPNNRRRHRMYSQSPLAPRVSNQSSRTAKRPRRLTLRSRRTPPAWHLAREARCLSSLGDKHLAPALSSAQTLGARGCHTASRCSLKLYGAVLAALGTTLLMAASVATGAGPHQPKVLVR
jgi:hypothetical protein